MNICFERHDNPIECQVSSMEEWSWYIFIAIPLFSGMTAGPLLFIPIFLVLYAYLLGCFFCEILELLMKTIINLYHKIN